QDGLRARDQLARAIGLRNVIVGANFQTAHDVVLLAAHGQQDNGHVRLLANVATDVKTVIIGQINVKDDQIGFVLSPPAARRGPVEGLNDVETGPLKREDHNFGQHPIVVHYQNFHDSSATGNVNQKRAPPSLRSSTPTEPPWA